jgi:hypothetical protein
LCQRPFAAVRSRFHTSAIASAPCRASDSRIFSLFKSYLNLIDALAFVAFKSGMVHLMPPLMHTGLLAGIDVNII